jgi:MFS family permease
MLYIQVFLALGIILVTPCVAAKSPEMLLLGRISIGFMCGMACMITPMYLAEVSTPRIRGAMMTAHQLLVTFGIFLSSVIGLREALSTTNGWPYLQLINAAPLLIAVSVLPFIPETPRYLLMVCAI